MSSRSERVGLLREGIESKLASFISDELLEEGGGEGDPLETDAIDSLGLEQLVEYIEEEFGITVLSDEMVRSNFGSIRALAEFVCAKLAATNT
jgi:acyl carrier protein